MMIDTNANLRAFQLKGSLLTLTVLELLRADMPAIQSQFLSLVKQTPDLFRRMPIILDLNKIQQTDSPLDFLAITTLLREHGMILVGARGGNPSQQAGVMAAGLAMLSNTRGEKSEKWVDKAENSTSPSQPQALSRLITQQVRSGQQIYAKGGDLIILNSVSPGAEILADGNIHVYGTLQGRALAGVNGDKAARIFCRKIDAELVSIAGHYWVNEDITALPEGQTIQVYLENDKLQMGAF